MLTRHAVAILAAVLLSVPVAARAQEVRSADLAKQLSQLLDQKKLDSIATGDQDPGTFHAALYFPGTQLLVVSAKYSAPPPSTSCWPEGLPGRLRRAHLRLDPSSKLFVMDAYANGLAVKPTGTQPPDSVERAGTSRRSTAAGRRRRRRKRII